MNKSDVYELDANLENQEFTSVRAGFSGNKARKLLISQNTELRIQNRSNLSINSNAKGTLNNISAFSQQYSAKKSIPISTRQTAHPKIMKPNFYDQDSVHPISLLDLS